MALLDVHFVFAGAALQALGEASYVRDTIRGRTKPNRMTWLIWTVAPLLAWTVEIHGGVGLRSLMTVVSGAGPGAILLASFVNRSSVWRLGRVDAVCGVLSVLGAVGWVVTRESNVALGAALGAVTLASIPTVIKAWRYPETETAIVYLGGLASATITLLTVNHANADLLAYPIDSALITSVMVAVIVVRRSRRLVPLSRFSGEPVPSDPATPIIGMEQ